MAGLRIVRGPDWKWAEQDCGQGHVGTIKRRHTTENWVVVLWDNGQENQYRAGAQNSADLSVLDNGPTGARHDGVTCDACGEDNLRGIRWKCADCPDYDLCTECYGNDRHDRNHGFKRINKRGQPSVNVGQRAKAVKVQARGIYKGAKVVRGDGWCRGDADGGAGSVGTVQQVGYKAEDNDSISAVVVIWPNGNRGIHCMGWTGRVDVKCKTEVIGWSYYKDHLPALKNLEDIAGTSTKINKEEDSPRGDLDSLFHKLLTAGLHEALSGNRAKKEATMKRFNTGELVKLNANPAVVERLQKGHGGFNVLMAMACGKVGVVRDIDGDGDLKVSFGDMEWCLNPEAVTKVSLGAQASNAKPTPQPTAPKPATPATGSATDAVRRYKVGDDVIITKDQATTKVLQKGHGGWNESMVYLVGTGAIGRVLEVDGDGDITVEFGHKSVILNPAVCSPAPTTTRSQAGGGIKPGDRVQIDGDLDFVKRTLRGHGGWVNAMKKGVHRVGTVQDVYDDGDVSVNFGDHTWTLHPDVCKLVKSGGRSSAFVKQKSTEKKMNQDPDAAGSSSTPTPVPRSSSDTAAVSAPSASTAAVSAPSASTAAVASSSGGTATVGQKLMLDGDHEFVKRKLRGHAKWHEDIRKVMTQVGTLKQIDEDGNYVVTFGDVTWTLLQDVCHVVSDSDQRAAPDIRRKKPTSTFKPGDQVKINVTADRLRELQRGHGGWKEQMIKAIGEVGAVKDVDSEGDLKVTFTGGTWTLNPDACCSMDPADAKKDINASVKADDVRRRPEGNDVGSRKSVSPYKCQVCLDVNICVVFNCGHGTCDQCSKRLDKCHICRQVIAMRTKMFI